MTHLPIWLAAVIIYMPLVLLFAIAVGRAIHHGTSDECAPRQRRDRATRCRADVEARAQEYAARADTRPTASGVHRGSWGGAA